MCTAHIVQLLLFVKPFELKQHSGEWFVSLQAGCSSAGFCILARNTMPGKSKFAFLLRCSRGLALKNRVASDEIL